MMGDTSNHTPTIVIARLVRATHFSFWSTRKWVTRIAREKGSRPGNDEGWNEGLE
jgi:hypothetical protein